MNLAEKKPDTGMRTRWWCPGFGLNLKGRSKYIGSIWLKELRHLPMPGTCYLRKQETHTSLSFPEQRISNVSVHPGPWGSCCSADLGFCISDRLSGCHYCWFLAHCEYQVLEDSLLGQNAKQTSAGLHFVSWQNSPFITREKVCFFCSSDCQLIYNPFLF